ncbi:MAG TPA: FadR/GntR family transcriptional regulator [Pseudolabrys sp.]|nr:FadR/GntR family transcriptional regulator [Pseudolabrys sp.]
MHLKKPLPRVSRTSLVDEVIGVMRTMLSEKAWAPGTKLPSEQELGRQLGVGRSTVREALRVLGHLGIVEAKSGLGTFVVDRGLPHGHLQDPQTPQDLKNLYEFRRAIEGPAARLAAQRRTAEALSRIKDAWRECELAVERDSATEFAQCDYVFHFSIVQASQNQFFIEAYKGLEAAFPRYVNSVLALGPLRSMLHFHDGLIAAIERADPDGAARAVAENFMETDVRLRLLSEQAGIGSSR